MRTFLTAQAILKDKELMITSFECTFIEFIDDLETQPFEIINNKLSCIVGDIQRIIIYPQFGWMLKIEVPKKVIEAYYYLKNIGFSKFILSEEQIKDLIKKNKIIDGFKENYFN